MTDPNTDEALVAEARDWLEKMKDRGYHPLLRESHANSIIDRLASRLSQPPSGGWDDAAVERAFIAHYRSLFDSAPPTEDEVRDSMALAPTRIYFAYWKDGYLAALNAAAPRESLNVEKEDE